MATRLKPSRINVDNTPRVGDGASYQNDNDFHWSEGGGDMSYEDFEWETLTGNSLVIEKISNNVTPTGNFTVSAGTLRPGIEYVLRVNTGNTPYTMTLGTGVTNPNGYNTELEPNTVNQFKFIATSTNQLELEGVDSAVISEINWGGIGGTLSDQTDLQDALDEKQDTLTAGNGINIDANDEIINTLPGPTIAATAPTGTEGALWYDTTNDVLMAHNGTAWKEAGTQMKVLSYGNSTWQEFLDAYNNNAIVYCRVSSQSNPGSGNQTRMAFMAFVDKNATTGVINGVEFQYYRSRSDHNTAANQVDEVYVYKLASDGTWTVTQRNTAAKAVAGTGISLGWGSGNMTISADTTVLATQTDLSSKQDTLVSGTNIKTVNNQSLLGSGNITISAPTYTAGTGIEIKNGSDYSAMQGPAPDGFHVPLVTEWDTVYNVWTALGGGSTDGANFGITLKLPFAGRRDYDSASVREQGTHGYYWSSSPRPSYANNSYNLRFSSSIFDPQNYNARAYGFSVRCFKNSPTIPTSSWTKLYGTSIEAGGIFWSSTDGLISLSSDGQTWITIADKNLGATTVWNSGDTLSEANMGNMYQWGNNYGFPSTGSVTTSSTRVDASNYGPGNYYSSDTFIKYFLAWDTTDNGNLRGGVTGVVTLNNVITNTGVLSVNGQTGEITIDDNTKIFVVNEPVLTSGGSISDIEPFKDICERLTSNPKHIVYITNKHQRLPHEQIYNGSVMQIISHSGRWINENNWMFGFIYIGFPFAENKEFFKYYGDIQVADGTARVANITADKINFAPGNSGTTGQVLTKTNSGYEWANASGGFQLAPNSPLSPKYRRYGTQAQYEALTQYYTDEEGDTVYFTI